MDLLRSEIINITKYKPEIGLKYYNDLLNIIDEYHDKKPDTSIETCKAIIEGISKLIIHKIDQEPIHILDNHKFERLTKRALAVLNEKSSIGNTEFIDKVIEILKILNTTRNNHSDIGHGRASVKEQINCQAFSEMISGFTESIAVYLLKKLDEVTIPEDAFESVQMQKYNIWLDNSLVDFPIKTERYSIILYKYDKDLYYTKYNEEFLIIDEIEESKEEERPKTDLKSTRKEEPIIDFQSEYFTLDKQVSLIKDFALTENLNLEKLTTILDVYFFTNETASRNQLIDLFLEKLSNEEQKTKSELLKSKITKLVETLNT